MKASKDRTEQFMHSTSTSALPAPNQNSLLFAQQPPPGMNGGPGTGLPGHDNGSGGGIDRKGKARAVIEDGKGDFLALDLDGDRGESGQQGGYQQMQLVEQQVSGGSSAMWCSVFLRWICIFRPSFGSSRANPTLRVTPGATSLRDAQSTWLIEQNDYIQSRSTAIESIESTIAELGQIFSQLAGMVAEQRETVQRIDADTTDIAA
jgi:syntaxin 5